MLWNKALHDVKTTSRASYCIGVMGGRSVGWEDVVVAIGEILV
jgi:hypothetical protein